MYPVSHWRSSCTPILLFMRSRFSTADQSPVMDASASSSSSVGFAAQPTQNNETRDFHVLFDIIFSEQFLIRPLG